MSVIAIIFNKRQGGGYELSVLKRGETVLHKDLMTTDPYAAAAYAITMKSRYTVTKILAPKEIMAILEDCE